MPITHWHSPKEENKTQICLLLIWLPGIQEIKKDIIQHHEDINSLTQTVQFLEQISFKGQKMGWRTYTWTTFQFKDFIWHFVQRNQKVCFQCNSKTIVGSECSVDTNGYLKNYCLLSYEKHYCGYLSKESLSFRDLHWNFYGWKDKMATISFKITHGRWVGRLQTR